MITGQTTLADLLARGIATRGADGSIEGTADDGERVYLGHDDYAAALYLADNPSPKDW